jgi:hypothetical protein
MVCNSCNKESDNLYIHKGVYICRKCYWTSAPDISPEILNDYLMGDNSTYKVEGTMIGEESVIFFGKENRVAFTIVDGKLDIEVTGEITEAAKMFLDKVKGMMIK